MILTIKQLQQNQETFAPQTVAEAVLVKHKSQVLTLNQVLDQKLEEINTPVDSGLSSIKQDNGVVILKHTNLITPNEVPEATKIQYNSNGHIIKVSPLSKQTLIVNGVTYSEYNGSEDSNIQMGDDFQIDKDKKIILKWHNI